MTTRNLEFLFAPRSVAVIGASQRANSVGGIVIRNLLRGGFAGPVMPVNPRYSAVAGVLAYPDVKSLPAIPDLAVICTPPDSVAGLIGELGERGTRAAVVLTSRLKYLSDGQGYTLERRMLEAARPYLMRVLGPNSLGVVVPAHGLNASFAPVETLPGKVALIHQSGALCTGLLDWARSHGIGFSHFVSIGDAADVDFGDVLDYLGSSPAARAVLLYVEAISHARKFMSAARAAARNKPVVVVKAGRVDEAVRAATSHTGMLTGADEVYDAAFRRAGMLRVYDTIEMFDAVTTLGQLHGFRGERVAILTNGGGPGVIATDAVGLAGGRLARLGPATLERLAEVTPPERSGANPVDIGNNAPPAQYAKALRILQDERNVDAVLVLHAPNALVSSEEAARAVVEAVAGVRGGPKVITSWIGGDLVQPGRRLFSEAGIPTYETPDAAVRALMHVVRYRRNQKMLMETPPSVPEEFEPDVPAARRVVEEILACGREVLTEPEAKAVLGAYGVPCLDTRIAASPEEAARVASNMGFPVALKILSPDVSHKSDVGGVALDLNDRLQVEAVARAMAERLHGHKPDARLSGFTVQPMARRPGAHELIIGATTDALFGPVVMFGHGGTGVEVIGDRSVCLPPLNMNLAREMVMRTRISRLLAGYGDHEPADVDGVCRTLLKVSQLVADIPEILEVDINPLFADQYGVLALDARMVIARAEAPGGSRLAIRPYPKELEEWIELDGQKVLLRPIRPEDEPQHHEFISNLDPEDMRFRFFGQLRQLPHSEMARFTQIDYDREMAFIASSADAEGRPHTCGVVRVIIDPDHVRAEYAIVVSSTLKGRGLGRRLMEKIIGYCRGRGVQEVVGHVMEANRRMLGLTERLGFSARRLPEGGVYEVRLALGGESG